MQKEVVQSNKREFKGTCVSNKMDKTIVVQVEYAKKHKVYGKVMTQRIKFKAHDELNKIEVGQVVTIQECRPLSKDKRWRVIYS